MLQLSSELIRKKNSIITEGVWAYCMLITLPDGTEFPVTTNGDPVVWNGVSYQPFPFNLDTIGGEKKGELPQSTVKVSNITRSLEPYLESSNGGIDSLVEISVVNTKLSEGPSAATYKFLCTGCKSDNKWVTFTLGINSPLRMIFPRNSIRKNICNWRFRSVTYCQYIGSETICNKTLSRCEALNNSLNFGGFPGSGRGGINV